MDDLRRQASSLGLGALTSMASQSIPPGVYDRGDFSAHAAQCSPKRALAGREDWMSRRPRAALRPGRTLQVLARAASECANRRHIAEEAGQGGTTPRKGDSSDRSQQRRRRTLANRRQARRIRHRAEPPGTQPDRAHSRRKLSTMAEAPATADTVVPRLHRSSTVRRSKYHRPVSRQPAQSSPPRTTTARRTNAGMLVAGLPADVAAYVNRSKGAAHPPGTARARRKGTLWIKFDKAR